ncbi:MAG TPA: hypothetical protein PLD05_14515 [Thermogutta sp.]|nr:hypothetical protein [Thermogutta sp.]
MSIADTATPKTQYWQPLSKADPQPDNPVAAAIWQVISRIYPNAPQTERRQAPRYAFPYLVQIQPVFEDGVSRYGSPFVVVGKQISELGLGFYHPKPLPSRYGIVSLDAGGTQISLLIELLWTQFTHHGWYESGGRFVRLLGSPHSNGNMTGVHAAQTADRMNF